MKRQDLLRLTLPFLVFRDIESSGLYITYIVQGYFAGNSQAYTV